MFSFELVTCGEKKLAYHIPKYLNTKHKRNTHTDTHRDTQLNNTYFVLEEFLVLSYDGKVGRARGEVRKIKKRYKDK